MPPGGPARPPQEALPELVPTSVRREGNSIRFRAGGKEWAYFPEFERLLEITVTGSLISHNRFDPRLAAMIDQVKLIIEQQERPAPSPPVVITPPDDPFGPGNQVPPGTEVITPPAVPQPEDLPADVPPIPQPPVIVNPPGPHPPSTVPRFAPGDIVVARFGGGTRYVITSRRWSAEQFEWLYEITPTTPGVGSSGTARESLLERAP